jgi:hypothetical protein
MQSPALLLADSTDGAKVIWTVGLTRLAQIGQRDCARLQPMDKVRAVPRGRGLNILWLNQKPGRAQSHKARAAGKEFWAVAFILQHMGMGMGHNRGPRGAESR